MQNHTFCREFSSFAFPAPLVMCTTKQRQHGDQQQNRCQQNQRHQKPIAPNARITVVCDSDALCGRVDADLGGIQQMFGQAFAKQFKANLKIMEFCLFYIEI